LNKLILDTSVCIDLYRGGLLETVLKLPYALILPDVIIAELIEPPGESLLPLGFRKESLAGDDIQDIIELRNRYPKPSTNDLFALFLARRNSCPIITGDAALRDAARQEGISVNGLLWLLDDLIKHGILTARQAAVALERVLEEGSWLPRKEYEIRLKKWHDESR